MPWKRYAMPSLACKQNSHWHWQEHSDIENRDAGICRRLVVSENYLFTERHYLLVRYV